MSEAEERRRTRWWWPGVSQAAQRDVGGAVYGLILATSVIAVSREYEPHDAGVTAVTVIVTATVFWLAHVYAGVLEIELRERHVPTWAEVRGVLDEEWPQVQAGLLPTVILLLGPLGVLADDTAQSVALGACLAELAGTGLLAARTAGARGLLVAASAAVTVGFGVVIVVLKALVH